MCMQKEWGDVLCNSVSDALYIKSVLVMTCARHFFFLTGYLLDTPASLSRPSCITPHGWLKFPNRPVRKCCHFLITQASTRALSCMGITSHRFSRQKLFLYFLPSNCPLSFFTPFFSLPNSPNSLSTCRGLVLISLPRSPHCCWEHSAWLLRYCINNSNQRCINCVCLIK